MIVRRIEVDIEELVLHGFMSGDRYRIGEAVEQELSRMLADEGIPESLKGGREVASVDGSAIEVATGSKTEAVGMRVAKAVYGGLKR